ncbi:RICIN domain-containing protein [Nonomuraea endophytica]|uniref:Ricin B lectin domain-containing protein n=1 Tax=Nonomuraea endophytica TaxID=714136 RepID=A0A7W8A6I7_9ACTN|nr:RICIN domain-containing protein [Nonomuraea endophytica]MBB5079143.1 hypothetical protein [Nonomuraea endophytica]
MSASHNLRRSVAMTLAAVSLSGIGALVASPAHAEVFKELEYRGDSARTVLTASANFNGADVVLRSDTNSTFGQWAQTSTVSSGGGQPAFIYTLRASINSGAPLCLTAAGTVSVTVAACDNSDRQKWFHPTAVVGPGGTLPTKNVQTLRHIGQSQSPSASPVTQFAQIGVHFWAKRTV